MDASSKKPESLEKDTREADTEMPFAGGCLVKEEIVNLLAEKKLFIRPLLSQDQIGEVTVDFRLGYDFLVSIQGREAYINTSINNWNESKSQRDIKQFFQSTRRQIGETFILHPHQTVLA